MSIKTKIQVKNGKWEINGRTLAEYKGDRKVVDALLISTFRINRIQSSVDDTHFRPEPQPKHWASLAEVVATVNRPSLKKQNHIFRRTHYDFKLGTPAFLEAHPNISTVSFVRAIGEE